MNGIGLWCIILSAVVLAQAIGFVITLLITSSKWYRKFVTRFAVGMTKDLDLVDEETEEGKKIINYIKEDY